MGLMNSTFMDDIIVTNEVTSLTKVAKPFNTNNNTPSGYKDSCMDSWKPIEVHIIEHKALRPREALKPQ